MASKRVVVPHVLRIKRLQEMNMLLSLQQWGGGRRWGRDRTWAGLCRGVGRADLRRYASMLPLLQLLRISQCTIFRSLSYIVLRRLALMYYKQRHRTRLIADRPSLTAGCSVGPCQALPRAAGTTPPAASQYPRRNRPPQRNRHALFVLRPSLR